MSEPTRGVFPAGLQQSFADVHTKPFWDAAREGRLAAPKCDACGTFVLPPKPYCFTCVGQDFTWTDLPGTGTVYTFTVVRHPLNPKLKDVVPYVSGVIELDGTQGAGARLVGNIIGAEPDEVRIGDRVEADFTPVGDDYAIMRFRRIGAAD